MKAKLKAVCAFAIIATVSPVIGFADDPAPANVISPTSPGNSGAAPNGIAATTSRLLFSQPFCPGLQTRGVYSVTNLLTGTSTLLTPFTVANTNLTACTENYIAIASGLGGFTAGDVYETAASPTTAGQEAVLKNGVLFIDHIPAPHLHVGITFDDSGTFSGALIIFAEGSVIGYGPTGAVLFTYPAPATYVLEGGAVAPLTYAPCPGCLYITGELATNVNNPNPSGAGAIFRVLPGTPSGTSVSLFTTTTGIIEPEDLQFVTNNALACSNQGYSYFVSSYASGVQKNTATATNGTILEFTPAQLTPYVGDFLVPNEINGTIYAYAASFSSAGTPVVFSSGDYQLEGSTILHCPTTGCPLTQGFYKNHGLPASMFGSSGLVTIGCQQYTASQLVDVLKTPPAGGNAVLILGHQLIAALANYASGATQTPAATLAIGEALSLLCANSLNLAFSFVQSGSALGQQLTALADTLDAYNSTCDQ